MQGSEPKYWDSTIVPLTAFPYLRILTCYMLYFSWVGNMDQTKHLRNLLTAYCVQSTGRIKGKDIGEEKRYEEMTHYKI